MSIMASWRNLKARLDEMVVRRDALVGINRRNVSFVYAHNPRSAYPEADDKLLCKALMAKHGVGLAKNSPELSANTRVECAKRDQPIWGTSRTSSKP